MPASRHPGRSRSPATRSPAVRAGYDANWFCYIASHATEHAAELDRKTLQRILALPGDLWLDVCGGNDE